MTIEISAKDVMKLRTMTGVGMMDCKEALKASNGDMDAAADFLRKKGITKAAKKAERVANEGQVASFVNGDKSRGCLVEINCETDFVAKTDNFMALAKDLAMQIAAMAPVAVDESDVSEDVIAKEKEIGRAKALEEGKPENIVDRIAEGMVKKFLKENTVLVRYLFGTKALTKISVMFR